MMRITKLMILLSVLSILLASNVSAGWFGFDTADVNGVSFKILEGFHTNELTGGDMLGFINEQYTSDIYPKPVYIYVGIHSIDDLNESMEYYMSDIDKNGSKTFVNKSSKQISSINTELIVVRDHLSDTGFKYIYFFSKDGKNFYMTIDGVLNDNELAEILNA